MSYPVCRPVTPKILSGKFKFEAKKDIVLLTTKPRDIKTNNLLLVTNCRQLINTRMKEIKPKIANVKNLNTLIGSYEKVGVTESVTTIKLQVMRCY